MGRQARSLLRPQLKNHGFSPTLTTFQTGLRAKLLAWPNGSASVMNFRIVPVSFDGQLRAILKL